MKTTKPTTLLNIDQNAKTVKGQSRGVMTGILYLAPSDLASTPKLKINVCPMAELAGCKVGCLNTAGRGRFSLVQMARVRRTRFFFKDRQGFMQQLTKEIEALIKKAKKHNLKPAVRLNGTSDIQWESVRFDYEFAFEKVRSITIFDLFPEVQFYDYTKLPNRTTPENYHLTFSYSNRPEFQPYANKALRNKNKNGLNIAVVFESREMVRDKMRNGSKFLGLPVIDGDESDVRFADRNGVVVGLYAKGKAKQDTSGFVVRSGVKA